MTKPAYEQGLFDRLRSFYDRPMSSTLKGWAAVFLALASLVTAVSVAFRKPPEDAARAGYLELTKAILDVQAVEKQNHEDLERLQRFVSERANVHESIIVPNLDAGAGRVVVMPVAEGGAPPVRPIPTAARPRSFDAL